MIFDLFYLCTLHHLPARESYRRRPAGSLLFFSSTMATVFSRKELTTAVRELAVET
jgi:hypothetical protein